MAGPSTDTKVEPAGSTATSTEPEPTTARSKVRCAACDAELTTSSRSVQRGGGHEHTFRNPAGYSWTLSCFRDAPGCAGEGEETTEATWFTGYAWRLAVCATCRRHVGWWFVGSGPSFIGLIVTRIVR
ncbi:MAG: cereblon family protein [Acidimicrobiia bacterium]|nr:cereblon family protein [Acidimicrobiia bacterium]